MMNSKGWVQERRAAQGTQLWSRVWSHQLSVGQQIHGGLRKEKGGGRATPEAPIGHVFKNEREGGVRGPQAEYWESHCPWDGPVKPRLKVTLILPETV